MKLIHKAGFTLIELLVALVVSGLLMASLVGISGAVQKSFGRSKDITDLQANLRFAMKSLVDDFGRVGFMYSPDPALDSHTACGLIQQAQPSIQLINLGSPLTFTLVGNFVSSRDYLLDLNQNRILCRNQMDTLVSPNCSTGGIVLDPYMLPFADGPDFTNVFCQNAMVRVDLGGRNYCYSLIAQPNPATLTVNLNPPVNRNNAQGQYFWINPVAAVTYTISFDQPYVARYTGNPNYNKRWMLNRATVTCQGNSNADLADFLLPPDDAQFPGLSIQLVNDLNGQIGGLPQQPNLQPLCTFIPTGNAGCTLSPQFTRAVVITLRARTEMEDPDFAISTYSPTSPGRNIGIDLDGTPADGLAHVRTDRTVVELRNLGMNQSSF